MKFTVFNRRFTLFSLVIFFCCNLYISKHISSDDTMNKSFIIIFKKWQFYNVVRSPPLSPRPRGLICLYINAGLYKTDKIFPVYVTCSVVYQDCGLPRLPKAEPSIARLQNQRSVERQPPSILGGTVATGSRRAKPGRGGAKATRGFFLPTLLKR